MVAVGIISQHLETQDRVALVGLLIVFNGKPRNICQLLNLLDCNDYCVYYNNTEYEILVVSINPGCGWEWESGMGWGITLNTNIQNCSEV